VIGPKSPLRLTVAKKGAEMQGGACTRANHPLPVFFLRAESFRDLTMPAPCACVARFGAASPHDPGSVLIATERR
jgi:hypothetical protein